ncbi:MULTISPECIES: hypothetical protein [unclassified Nocardioides]|jgi:hypothetical protein|uniref:hypothetical protein n=1 Tax=unclassified Nocardioides TaxID=2615069 RepID=UPI000702BEA4|nr:MULTISPECIES: hypothetical protein [unclassified Nocardioides]KRC57362.1 hypothetical protein ASE19_23860 [Nocardioides sp. Root79]KRC74208.1 hypothetical protein ASE20_23820 [Nocardioides sp. Root240]
MEVHHDAMPEEASMFTHDCPSCGRRELIFNDQVTALENHLDGFLITFTCWCGATGTHLEERIVPAA